MVISDRGNCGATSGGFKRRLGRGVLLLRHRFVVQFGFRLGNFLKDGILLEFLLDQRLEFKRRRLEQRQRVLQLR